MIIGICGKKRSGKDTIADILVNTYDFKKYAFGDPIKKVAKIIFNFSEEQLYGESKDLVDERWGISPREFFQKFGTDYGQYYFNEQFPNILKDKPRNLWVEVFHQWYENQRNNDRNLKIVISDVRFQHEIDKIKELGGYIIKVERNSINLKDSHLSENEIDNIHMDNFNLIINNEGTKEDLFKIIKENIN